MTLEVPFSNIGPHPGDTFSGYTPSDFTTAAMDSVETHRLLDKNKVSRVNTLTDSVKL